MQTIGDGGEGADPVGRVESELSPDDIFKTLSNRRRRHVLHYLRHIDGTVTIRDLSEQLAELEGQVETVTDGGGSPQPFQDPELVHKVVHACMDSDKISEEEELRILDSLL